MCQLLKIIISYRQTSWNLGAERGCRASSHRIKTTRLSILWNTLWTVLPAALCQRTETGRLFETFFFKFVFQTRVAQKAPDSTVNKPSYSFLLTKCPWPLSVPFPPFIVSSQRSLLVSLFTLLHITYDGKLPTANEVSFVTRDDSSNNFFNTIGYSNILSLCCHVSVHSVIILLKILRPNENLSNISALPGHEKRDNSNGANPHARTHRAIHKLIYRRYAIQAVGTPSAIIPVKISH